MIKLKLQPAVKERPILFGTPMVRAILAGRKTQTRRVAKPPAKAVFLPGDRWINDIDEPGTAYIDDGSGRLRIRCPYGKPGDRLWVRETFVTGYDTDDSGYLITEDDDGEELPEKVWYRATEPAYFMWQDEHGEKCDKVPWKPSIHMPRWASRITLEITGVRVERLQEISEADAIAEGIQSWEQGYPRSTGEPYVGYETLYGFGRDVGWVPTAEPTAVFAFQRLWDSIDGPAAWDANPWVWVVTFSWITET